ncbi:NADH dehydrogenase [Phytophthora cinnamomi]|nr:NADH dehydrogenase [Phytophthora cinnamomi]
MLARPGIAAAAPRARALTLLAPHCQALGSVTQTQQSYATCGATSSSLRARSKLLNHDPPILRSALQVVTPQVATSHRCFSTSSSDVPLHFDTHNVVTSLQERGFTVDQSEAILQVMKDAMADSLEAQSRILATKSEHVELKAELSERVFNSTLKFDIAQRHSRELLERDFNTLKQDIRMLEKIDFDKIRMEIAELEKKFLLQKQAEDETLNELRLSMEKVEKRMLQYAVGFAGTIMAVGAALLRLVL